MLRGFILGSVSPSGPYALETRQVGQEEKALPWTSRSKQKLPRILARFPLCMFVPFFLCLCFAYSFQKPVSVSDHVMTWIFCSLSWNLHVNVSPFARSLCTEFTKLLQESRKPEERFVVADKLTMTETAWLWGCLGYKRLCGKPNKAMISPGHSISEGTNP